MKLSSSVCSFPNPSRQNNRYGHASLDLAVSQSGHSSSCLSLFCSFPKSLNQFFISQSLTCLPSLFLALALLFFLFFNRESIKLTVEPQQLPSRDESVSCQAPNYTNTEVRKKEEGGKKRGREGEKQLWSVCERTAQLIIHSSSLSQPKKSKTETASIKMKTENEECVTRQTYSRPTVA